MNTKVSILVLLVGLLCFPSCKPGPPGRSTLRIIDVTERDEVAVHAPWLPFRNGNVLVTAKGSFTGTAILHIFYDGDRHHESFNLTSGAVEVNWGGAESWCGDIRVVYEPIEATSGDLTIDVLCGRN